jgi:hypothetical protein
MVRRANLNTGLCPGDHWRSSFRQDVAEIASPGSPGGQEENMALLRSSGDKGKIWTVRFLFHHSFSATTDIGTVRPQANSMPGAANVERRWFYISIPAFPRWAPSFPAWRETVESYGIRNKIMPSSMSST